MLGPKSQRLLSLKHEGGEEQMKVRDEGKMTRGESKCE
jgi:hypothetical protein